MRMINRCLKMHKLPSAGASVRGKCYPSSRRWNIPARGTASFISKPAHFAGEPLDRDAPLDGPLDYARIARALRGTRGESGAPPRPGKAVVIACGPREPPRHPRIHTRRIHAVLLVINATERPPFSPPPRGGCAHAARHTGRGRIDPRPRGRGLESVTRTAGRGRGAGRDRGRRREATGLCVHTGRRLLRRPRPRAEPPLTLSNF